MIDRTKRPHVQQRLREIQDPDGDAQSISPTGTTVQQRMEKFQWYCTAIRDAQEPDQLNDEDLLDNYDNFMSDANRYGAWTSERNWAIEALADEWAMDCRTEIARRMNHK